MESTESNGTDSAVTGPWNRNLKDLFLDSSTSTLKMHKPGVSNDGKKKALHSARTCYSACVSSGCDAQIGAYIANVCHRGSAAQPQLVCRVTDNLLHMNA